MEVGRIYKTKYPIITEEANDSLFGVIGSFTDIKICAEKGKFLLVQVIDFIKNPKVLVTKDAVDSAIVK